MFFDSANYYVCWGTKSSSSQSLTALLTTALIIGLYDHLKERIPNIDSFLEITATPLHVLGYNRLQHEVSIVKGNTSILI